MWKPSEDHLGLGGRLKEGGKSPVGNPSTPDILLDFKGVPVDSPQVVSLLHRTEVVGDRPTGTRSTKWKDSEETFHSNNTPNLSFCATRNSGDGPCIIHKSFRTDTGTSSHETRDNPYSVGSRVVEKIIV